MILMVTGNISRGGNVHPLAPVREGWGFRDRSDHLPRFERCFIGLFTASSMIRAGEGVVMEARRNESPPWEGHDASIADHSNAAATSWTHASASTMVVVGGCLEWFCDHIC